MRFWKMNASCMPITVKPSERDRLRNGGLRKILMHKLQTVGIRNDDRQLAQTSHQGGGETDPLLSRHTQENL